MRKFAILSLLFSASAWAQEPPSQDTLVAEYYIETGQLRVALGQQMKATIEARKEIERLKAEKAEK